MARDNLYSPTDVSGTTRLYEEAAWLALNSGIWAGVGETPVGRTADVSWAIWKLFDPSLSVGQGALDLIALAQKEAPTDLSYYSSVRILTPKSYPDGTPWTDLTSPQEYLTVLAPEPASLWLFAAGLCALALCRMNKWRLARAVAPIK